MRHRIVLLTGWLTLCVGGAQQVEFAPDFYSFEEIAKKLSVGRHKVVCAPELRERVALVALQPREWQQARELLEQGLDIRLRRISEKEKRWRLERNAEVAKQERQLLEQHIQKLQRELETALAQRRELFLNLPNTPDMRQLILRVLETADLSEDALKPLAAFVRSASAESLSRDERAFRRLNAIVAEHLARLREASPDAEWESLREQAIRDVLTRHSWQELGFSDETLRWARTQVEPTTADETELLLRQYHAVERVFSTLSAVLRGSIVDYLTTRLAQRLQVRDALLQGVAQSESRITLSPDVAEWLMDLLREGSRRQEQFALPHTPIEWQVVATLTRRDNRLEYMLYLTPAGACLDEAKSFIIWHKDAHPAVGGTGDAIAQAFHEAQQRTAQLLRLPACQRPIKPVRCDANRIYLVYEWLYYWSWQHQQEVIAEIQPLSASARHSIRDLDEKAEPSLQQLFQLWQEIYRDRRRGVDGMLPLTLEQHEGVWIVRDWGAFLTRAIDYPTASIKRLMRSPLHYTDWLQFLHMLRPMQLRQTERMLGSAWNEELGEMFAQASKVGCDFGVAWLVTRLLEGLPPDERARMLRPGIRANIPLWKVSPAALEQFVAGLRLLEAHSYVPTSVIAFNRCREPEALLRKHGYLATWDHGLKGWKVAIGDPESRESPVLVYGFASLNGDIERRGASATPSAKE